jgi:hypothetical protein
MFTSLFVGKCIKTNRILDLSCLQNLDTDRIENTASNGSSTVESRSYRTDLVENTASQLVHWYVLGICCLATDVVYRDIT